MPSSSHPGPSKTLLITSAAVLGALAGGAAPWLTLYALSPWLLQGYLAFMALLLLLSPCLAGTLAGGFSGAYCAIRLGRRWAKAKAWGGARSVGIIAAAVATGVAVGILTPALCAACLIDLIYLQC
jgi:hypothetical protein